ncbi:protein trichome birefringence-like 31 isoform X2 [Asparagus officinalis]|uniref:protein trichome birefringence-like 31 isoform X2 n=1 Tax=Asparagus officinalis TaxID=4686 RepID=UPI00098E270D|nr:protein trichome birefringence-like 31 isoform X2 [Asparagus officinalis]
MSSLLTFLLASLVLIGAVRIVTDVSGSTGAWIHEIHHWLFSPVFYNHFDEDFANAFRNGCNLFDGKWALEEDGSRPLYTEDSCPYLTQPVTCQRNGRPDSTYQRWKWEPRECKLPRFDALMLLRSLRNKRLMFIGDSLQRTQWESMVCLLQSVVPDRRKSVYKDPPRRIFFVEDYNATVEFYWAPFIVESNSDHATKHTVQKRQVRLDSVDKHSKKWEGVDILVFESYVWWMYKPLINATFGSSDVKEYNIFDAYKLALKTWANWLESTFNPQLQKAFFMSLSPTHLCNKQELGMETRKQRELFQRNISNTKTVLGRRIKS